MKEKGVVRKPLWWEKTVEWKFALSASMRHNLLVVPLSADKESALSDVWASFKGKLALVEFKRERADCHGYSEMKKYARHIATPSTEQAQECFSAACKELNTVQFPGHTSHLFVYGVLADKPASVEMQHLFGLEAMELDMTAAKLNPHPAELCLVAATYWEREALTKVSALKAIEDHAVAKQDFDSYVSRLANLRSYQASTESQGASVLGFEEGSVTIVVDILDYVRENKLDVTPKSAAQKTTTLSMKPK